MSEDRLLRAYARLRALRDALAKDRAPDFGLEYVEQFHGALDHLRQAGIEVDEFMVPNRAIKQSSTFGPYVDRSLLLAQLDAVIGYFELTTTEPKRHIGFRPRAADSASGDTRPDTITDA